MWTGPARPAARPSLRTRRSVRTDPRARSPGCLGRQRSARSWSLRSWQQLQTPGPGRAPRTGLAAGYLGGLESLRFEERVHALKLEPERSAPAAEADAAQRPRVVAHVLFGHAEECGHVAGAEQRGHRACGSLSSSSRSSAYSVAAFTTISGIATSALARSPVLITEALRGRRARTRHAACRPCT